MKRIKCHCGKPLHYTDKKVEIEVKSIIKELGEYLPVTVGNRTWLVQRHYIALHGLKAKDLPTLEFDEVKK